jgi:hypothetical protein
MEMHDVVVMGLNEPPQLDPCHYIKIIADAVENSLLPAEA